MAHQLPATRSDYIALIVFIFLNVSLVATFTCATETWAIVGRSPPYASATAAHPRRSPPLQLTNGWNFRTDAARYGHDHIK